MSTFQRWSIGVVLASAAGLYIRYVVEPSAERVVEWLVYGTAPPATLFALIYGLTTPWWRSLIGRALLVSSTALALLVDLALLFQWLGPEYLGRSYVRVTVFGLVCLGAWLKFAALVGMKIDSRRSRRIDRELSRGD